MGWLTYKADWYSYVNNDWVFYQKFNIIVPDFLITENGPTRTTVYDAIADTFGSYAQPTIAARFLYWTETMQKISANAYADSVLNHKSRIYVGPKSDDRYIEITLNYQGGDYDKFTLDYVRGGTSYWTNSNWNGSGGPFGSGNTILRPYGLPWGIKVDGAYRRANFSVRTIYKTNTGNIIEAQVMFDGGYAAAWFENWIGNLEPIDTDNPYANGGTSTESDDEGNFSEDSDTVTVDNLPSIDAIGTGFATLFTPSKGQLANLADVMWNNNIFTALQNLVENITNMFTSLAIVPFTVTPGATVEVTWLGLPLTEIFLTLASKQYYEFDMGSINLANDNRIFTSGSALDYSPFSKLGIFLPFIGFEELDVDECRNSTIGLKYRIDILSGTCVALISIGGNSIYQFTGNCLSQIPITNESMQSLVSDAVNVGIAATQASAAKGAVGAAESGLEEAQKAESGVKVAEGHLEHAKTHLLQTRSSLASATANAAMGMKPTFGKNGSVSAAASLLAVKQPYLFLTTPRQSMPEHYQKYNGFPSNLTGKLNTFSGYTVVESIRLNGLVATSPEVEEIYSLLQSGVII